LLYRRAGEGGYILPNKPRTEGIFCAMDLLAMSSVQALSFSVAVWFGAGFALAVWSYLQPPLPPQWWIGFIVLAALWPLAFAGYAVEIVEAQLQKRKHN
jgi:hypothetical protein